MKSIPLSELTNNRYFDQPVFLDKGFLLLTPDSPVTPDLVRRLQKWKYTQVLTDGSPKDLPSYVSASGQSGLSTQTIDEGIHETEQMRVSRKFYTDFTTFTSMMFARFTAEGVLDIAEVTEWIKKAMKMVHDNRDFLLRCFDTAADGDRYLITHAVNSTILALAVSEYMKTPPHRLIELGNACLLHEIGMFKLPVELRRSSKGLSPEERKAMMTHTVLGYRLLKGISAPENVALAALEHHERIDGSGYPRNLAFPKITDHALIIGVVCSYDAMVSRRPFRAGTLDGHATILDLAQKNRKQYDEKILKALVYTLSVYPVGTAVQLSDKSRAIVMKTDPTKPRCPIVRVLRDPEGKPIAEPQLVQVSDGQGLTIAGALGAEDAKELKEME